MKQFFLLIKFFRNLFQLMNHWNQKYFPRMANSILSHQHGWLTHCFLKIQLRRHHWHFILRLH